MIITYKLFVECFKNTFIEPSPDEIKKIIYDFKFLLALIISYQKREKFSFSGKDISIISKQFNDLKITTENIVASIGQWDLITRLNMTDISKEHEDRLQRYNLLIKNLKDLEETKDGNIFLQRKRNFI